MFEIHKGQVGSLVFTEDTLAAEEVVLHPAGAKPLGPLVCLPRQGRDGETEVHGVSSGFGEVDLRWG